MCPDARKLRSRTDDAAGLHHCRLLFAVKMSQARGPPQVVVFRDPALAGQKRPRPAEALHDEASLAAERRSYLSGSRAEPAARTAQASGSRQSPNHAQTARPINRLGAAGSAAPATGLDFRTVLHSVQRLGATTLTGAAAKAWEMEQLNALGANLRHVEKMPRRMAQGVMRARAVRAAKRKADERAAGIVTARVRDGSGGRGGSRSTGDDGGSEAYNRQQPRDLDADNIRGPVMYVRLPKKR